MGIIPAPTGWGDRGVKRAVLGKQHRVHGTVLVTFPGILIRFAVESDDIFVHQCTWQT